MVATRVEYTCAKFRQFAVPCVRHPDHPEVNLSSPCPLLRALRIVMRADSDPARQALFANLMQSRLPVRLAFGLHDRLRHTPAAALVIAGYALVSFISVAP